jgi:hypothetical protein
MKSPPPRRTDYTVRATSLGGRRVRFVITTGALDRHGSRIDPRGMRAENFLKNPVFLWNHQREASDPSVVLGRVVGLQATDRAVVADVEFLPAGVNQKADLALWLVQNRFLRSVSIGLGVPPDAAPPTRKNGVEEIPEWELWEVSLVPVGSNPEALAVRRLLSQRRSVLMNKDEVLKKLGLQEGCSRGDCEAAMKMYLLTSEDGPDVRAQVAAACGALCESLPEQAADPAAPASGEAAAPSDPADPEAGGAGSADDGENKAADEEMEGLRAANAMLAQEAQKARAAKPAAPSDIKTFTQTAIDEGRWPAERRAELLAMPLKRAQAAVRAVPKGTFDPQKSRMFTPSGATRSAPNVGNPNPEQPAKEPSDSEKWANERVKNLHTSIDRNLKANRGL